MCTTPNLIFAILNFVSIFSVECTVAYGDSTGAVTILTIREEKNNCVAAKYTLWRWGCYHNTLWRQQNGGGLKMFWGSAECSIFSYFLVCRMRKLNIVVSGTAWKPCVWSTSWAGEFCQGSSAIIALCESRWVLDPEFTKLNKAYDFENTLLRNRVSVYCQSTR